MTCLHEQYRPRCWGDVAGHQDAVSSIRKVLSRGWGGNCWFITGLSGQGKSTLGGALGGDQRYACKPLGFDGKAGWAFIVNEAHGMRKDTVTEFLDVLERLPPYVCWIFTTTRTGQAKLFEDDENGDAAPLVSRCKVIDLPDNSEVRKALALRAKTVAQAANLDGLPDEVYYAALDAVKGNLRALLQRVESGQLGRDALVSLEREYAMLRSTKGDHAAKRRAELEAAIAAAKGGAV